VVRRAIAEGVLGNVRPAAEAGVIRLHEHQLRAVAHARYALREYGGVLLADSAGLGKTYVALAVSRDYRRVTVVGPAVLRTAWRESAARTEATIRYVTTESLSRTATAGPATDLVIVDEAHHFRNPRTRRYTRLAQLTANAHVLLLTATPIHNRREDLAALLALFLGTSLAQTPEMLARTVIRREHGDVPLAIPRLSRMRRIVIPGSAAVVRTIQALPPPLCPRDGGDAASLVRLGLLHLWTSSDAALTSGIRRRLTAGAAMRAALVIGRIPARRELRSWLAADNALQLGFTDLLVEQVTPCGPAELAALDAHLAALRDLLSTVRAAGNRDAQRALQLKRLLSKHGEDRVLAFSSYAATVHALFAALACNAGVGAATARGGWIASGRVKREEVLRMFSSPAHRRERICLLLATDMLSEGLNLQTASVIVHLDLPWTPARLEQRVGRVRRQGSASSVVRSYAFVQPAAIERLVGKEQLISSKNRWATEMIGTPAYDGAVSLTAPSAPRAAEEMRQVLGEWLGHARPPANVTATLVAAVIAESCGFIALLRRGDGAAVIAGLARPRLCDPSCEARGGSQQSVCAQVLTASTDPAVVCEALAAAGGGDAAVERRSYLAARRAIARYIADDDIRRTAGTAATPIRELRAVLQRLDIAVAGAPLHMRPGLAARVSGIRKALSGRLSRGLEIAIADLAHTLSDHEEFICALEALLADPRAPHAVSDQLLVAVLLLKACAQRTASANPISCARRS
jgi:hypothetical protein